MTREKSTSIAELAKHLELTPKKALQRAKALGIRVSGVGSTLWAAEARAISETLELSVAELRKQREELLSKYNVQLPRGGGKVRSVVPRASSDGVEGGSPELDVVQKQIARLQERIRELENAPVPPPRTVREVRGDGAAPNRQLRDELRTFQQTSSAELSELRTRLGSLQQSGEEELASLADRIVDLSKDNRAVLDGIAEVVSDQVGVREGLERLGVEITEVATRASAGSGVLEEGPVGELRSELEADRRANSKELASLVDRIQDLSRDNGAVLESIADVVSEQAGVREGLERLGVELTEIASRVRRLESDAETGRNDRERISRAESASAQVEAPEISIRTPQITRVLAQEQIHLPEDTVSTLASALDSGRPLLLVGPPGTGKTRLVRALPQVAFAEESEGVLRRCELEAAWGSFDVLGGEWPTDRGAEVRLGEFSKAVIECVESEGRRWLFFDELNQANVHRAFAGIMDTLHQMGDGRGESATLELLDHTVRIPSSFRLICAMNDSDRRHLSPVSNAVLDRFEVVRIPMPTPEVERRILMEQGMPAEAAREGRMLSDVLGVTDGFPEALSEFLDTMAELRAAGSELGADECYLGARYSIQVVRAVVRSVLREEAEPRIAFDRVIEQEILVRLREASAAVLREVARGPLNVERYPKTHDGLQVLVRREEAMRLL